jgi:predicted Fe-S protein YdhL (DUF1289 family)
MEETKDWIEYTEKQKTEVLIKTGERKNPVVSLTDHLNFYV